MWVAGVTAVVNQQLGGWCKGEAIVMVGVRLRKGVVFGAACFQCGVMVTFARGSIEH